MDARNGWVLLVRSDDSGEVRKKEKKKKEKKRKKIFEKNIKLLSANIKQKNWEKFEKSHRYIYHKVTYRIDT